MTPEEIAAIVAGTTKAVEAASSNNKKSESTSLFVKAKKSDVTIGFFNIFTTDEAQIEAVTKALVKAGMVASIYDPDARKESPGFGL